MRESNDSSARGGQRRSRLKKWLIALFVLFLLGSTASTTAAAYFLEKLGRTPREWAPYLLRRAQKHNALVTGTTALIAGILEYMDRIPGGPTTLPPTWVGANVKRLATGNLNPEDTRQHLVASVPSLYDALANAVPGDVIELLPGHYRIDDPSPRITRPGRADAPITLRAARLGDVVLESATIETIKINVPYWHFENLVVRGMCSPQNDTYCEHAFHVVGDAKGIEIRNNLLVDFNAQIKINAEDGAFPDNGIIDHNTLTDTRPRATSNPVTPIDLDAASGWLMSDNLITDFIKAGGDQISYGGFAKAAGENNVFARNVVLCESRLLNQPGQRVGLSLGGGGSGDGIRRDGGRSGLEHNNGRISDNLIAFCSDAGVYINKAKESRIEHNTILDTSGIEVRFPQSSAEIEANIIDGIIAVRDGATISARSNEESSLLGLFVGWHPQRRSFVDVAGLDLEWRGLPPRDSTLDPHPDLCGASRALQPAIGAFENFAACERQETK